MAGISFRSASISFIRSLAFFKSTMTSSTNGSLSRKIRLRASQKLSRAFTYAPLNFWRWASVSQAAKNLLKLRSREKYCSFIAVKLSESAMFPPKQVWSISTVTTSFSGPIAKLLNLINIYLCTRDRGQCATDSASSLLFEAAMCLD